MATINEALDQVMGIEGAFACMLVDFDSGMTLGARTTREDFEVELATSSNSQVVRATLDLMRQLDIAGGIKDILVSVGSQCHLIRPLGTGAHFLYLAIDRQNGNLGLARHKLAAIETALRPN